MVVCGHTVGLKFYRFICRPSLLVLWFSWAAVTIVLQEKLKIGNKSWAFQYFDDEDDVIFVSRYMYEVCQTRTSHHDHGLLVL